MFVRLIHVCVLTNSHVCLLRQERQLELRCQVSGFTPWTDPVATMLRLTSPLTRPEVTLNIRLLTVAAHLL